MLLRPDTGQPDAVSRVAPETAVTDRVLEDHREDTMVRADGARANAAALVRDPRLDSGVRDRVQRRRAPPRLEAPAGDGDVALQGAGLDLHERVDPLLAPSGEGDACLSGRHIVASRLRELQGRQVQLGVTLGAEPALVGLLVPRRPVADSIAPPRDCLVCAYAPHQPHPRLECPPVHRHSTARWRGQVAKRASHLHVVVSG